MKKFTVIIENKNYRTKSHTSINAYNAWNRNWQIVDKQMIFELCYIEAIKTSKRCLIKTERLQAVEKSPHIRPNGRFGFMKTIEQKFANLTNINRGGGGGGVNTLLFFVKFATK